MGTPHPLTPSDPLAQFTCSVFRLDALYTKPVEAIVDIVPGITRMRVTLDMIESETASYEYDVTEHAITADREISSHVRKRLETITISGIIGRTPPMLPVPGPPNFKGLIKLDLLRLEHLKRMADERLPVMVLTPRVGLARAFLTSVRSRWSPGTGEAISVSIIAREARLVSPQFLAAIAADYPAQESGNNAATGGGQSSTEDLGEVESISDAPGIPSQLGAAA